MDAPRLQNRGDRRPIGGAAADVMQSHDSRRIDEDVAAKLSSIRTGVFRQPAPCQLFRVGPPGPQSPDVPQLSPVHAVMTVQRAVVVDENGPGDVHFADVRPNERAAFKRHHHDIDLQLLERPFVLLQLQQVPAAGQSTKVAMKHQQEPMILEIGEAMNAALGIRQLEGKSPHQRTSP